MNLCYAFIFTVLAQFACACDVEAVVWAYSRADCCWTVLTKPLTTSLRPATAPWSSSIAAGICTWNGFATTFVEGFDTSRTENTTLHYETD